MAIRLEGGGNGQQHAARTATNVIAAAIRPVDCVAQKLRSILLYLSLTVEEMETRLQAGGAQWLGQLGGLYGMGEKTTAVIHTYYQGIFDFVVDTNVHRIFVDAKMAPIPRGKGGARYPADQCQWGSEQAARRANTTAARRPRLTGGGVGGAAAAEHARPPSLEAQAWAVLY